MVRSCWLAVAAALRKRCFSFSRFSSFTLQRDTCAAPSSMRKTWPITTPSETPSPLQRSSRVCSFISTLPLLVRQNSRQTTYRSRPWLLLRQFPQHSLPVRCPQLPPTSARSKLTLHRQLGRRRFVAEPPCCETRLSGALVLRLHARAIPFALSPEVCALSFASSATGFSGHQLFAGGASR